MRRLLFLAAVLTSPLRAQTFAAPEPFLAPPLFSAHMAWADFDADGALDLAVDGAYLTPEMSTPEAHSTLYAGVGGRFTAVQPLYGRPTGWVDYDGDGRLDLVLADEFLGVLLNRPDGFVHRRLSLPAVGADGTAWADVDGDGDLDLALVGNRHYSYYGALYRNDGNGTFRLLQPLQPLQVATADWADYDLDGDPDLLVTGGLPGSHPQPFTQLYRNDAGTLVPVETGLPQVWWGAVAWGDYDADGDPDLYLTGTTGERVAGGLFRNDGGRFVPEQPAVTPLTDGQASWDDFDGDGDLDLTCSTVAGVVFYRNTGGVLAPVTFPFMSLRAARGTWQDVDGDGDLDFALLGLDGAAQVTRGALYRATGSPSNTPPQAPTALRADAQPGTVTLRWGAASDAQSPAPLLRYALRVGRSPGAADVVQPFAGAAPSRLLPGTHHTTAGTTRRLHLSPGTYYWSVQTVDPAGAASAFAPEQTFTLDGPEAQAFQYVPLGFEGSGQLLSYGTAGVLDGAWGDYDGDGRWDLLVHGALGIESVTRLLRATSDGYAQQTTSLPDLQDGAAAWADYDGDGALDLLLTGSPVIGEAPHTYVFRQSEGTFQRQNLGLPGAGQGVSAWLDADADGDLDVLLSTTRLNKRVHLYRQTALHAFEEMRSVLSEPYDPVYAPAYPHGGGLDHDGDGDADLHVRDRLFDNHAGAFVAADLALGSVVTWADVDLDGDLDVFSDGKVLLQHEGRFAVHLDELPGLDEGPSYSRRITRAAWGDFDADGDPDLTVALQRSDRAELFFYRNDAGSLTPVLLPIPDADTRALTWGDYDGDGRLDLLVGHGQDGLAIYRQSAGPINVRPSPPSGGTAEQDGAALVLRWNAARDAETPAAALTYNLRVGTRPGAGDVMSAHARPDGRRLVAGPGNAGPGLTWTLRHLPTGTYHWSVQALDAGFAASAFMAEQSFTVGGPAPLSAESFARLSAPLPGVASTSTPSSALLTVPSPGLVLLKSGQSLPPPAPPGTQAALYQRDAEGNYALHQALDGYVAFSTWADADHDGDVDVLGLAWQAPTLHLVLLRTQPDQRLHPDTLDVPQGYAVLAADWMDADADGHPDVLFVANGSASQQSALYAGVLRNDGTGRFSPHQISRIADYSGSVLSLSVLDFDGDGRDEAIIHASFARAIALDFDEPAPFVRALPLPVSRRLLLRDADADGDVDFLAVDHDAYSLYRSVADSVRREQPFGQLSQENANVYKDAAWGDLDGDGDPDAVLTDLTRTSVYLNESGRLVEAPLHFEGFNDALVALVDEDGDGHLDVLLSGVQVTSGTRDPVDQQRADALTAAAAQASGTSAPRMVLYRQAGAPAPPPTAPRALQAHPVDSGVELSWAPGPDAAGYALRVGTTAGGLDVVSPAAALHEPARPPGAFVAPSRWLNLPPGTYHWSVVAFDHRGLRSREAAERTFTLLPSSTEPEADVLAPGMSLAPNPTRGNVRLGLTLPAADRVGVAVYDLWGRCVHRRNAFDVPAGTSHVVLDLHALSSGTYALHLDAARAGRFIRLITVL